MKVFISWSGSTSRQVAEALRDWLPDVIQQLQPFLPSRDIASGSKWQDEISTRLDDTTFGVICLTADNHEAPWINFEAGALSKYVEDSLVRVVPLLHGLKKTDIKYPLAMFQAVTTAQDDILDLVRSLNTAAGEPLSEERLVRQVERSWPDLDEKMRAIQEPKAASAKPERSAADMLEEILAALRERNEPPSRGTLIVQDAPDHAEERKRSRDRVSLAADLVVDEGFSVVSVRESAKALEFEVQEFPKNLSPSTHNRLIDIATSVRRPLVFRSIGESRTTTINPNFRPGAAR